MDRDRRARTALPVTGSRGGFAARCGRWLTESAIIERVNGSGEPPRTVGQVLERLAILEGGADRPDRLPADDGLSLPRSRGRVWRADRRRFLWRSPTRSAVGPRLRPRGRRARTGPGQDAA